MNIPRLRPTTEPAEASLGRGDRQSPAQSRSTAAAVRPAAAIASRISFGSGMGRFLPALPLGPFQADGDAHFIAQGLGELLRPYAELGAFDRQLGRKSGALGAWGKLGRSAADHFELDGLGGAVHGEVARHFVAVLDWLDAGALERDGGELLGVEEVRTA